MPKSWDLKASIPSRCVGKSAAGVGFRIALAAPFLDLSGHIPQPIRRGAQVSPDPDSQFKSCYALTLDLSARSLRSDQKIYAFLAPLWGSLGMKLDGFQSRSDTFGFRGHKNGKEWRLTS